MSLKNACADAIVVFPQLGCLHYRAHARRSFTTHPAAGIQWSSSKPELATLARYFAEVFNAAPVPIYLGEFGIVPAIVNATQGALWFRAVRLAAVHAGFAGYSAWTYFGTQNGLIAEADGATAHDRLCAWDHSVLVRAATGLESPTLSDHCSMSEPRHSTPLAPPSSDSTPRACPVDGKKRPMWADGLLESRNIKAPLATWLSTDDSWNVTAPLAAPVNTNGLRFVLGSPTHFLLAVGLALVAMLTMIRALQCSSVRPGFVTQHSRLKACVSLSDQDVAAELSEGIRHADSPHAAEAGYDPTHPQVSRKLVEQAHI